MAAIFGPSGCGDEFLADGHSELSEVPQWLQQKGLHAYEYSFGHGYRMKTETATRAGELFKQADIVLSLHAPYYINFANPDAEMYQKSAGYLHTAIKFLHAFGVADRVVFHPGSCGKEPRNKGVQLIAKRFEETLFEMEANGELDGIWLCPETMGKTAQIGTYQEIIDLCTIHPHLIPAFDFGHINALTQGSLKTKHDFQRIFDYAIEKLGFDRASTAHIHFSKIQYGEKGEIRHLNFDDTVYGPEFEPLAEVLVDYKLSPRVICESAGMQPADAVTMQNIYTKLLDK